MTHYVVHVDIDDGAHVPGREISRAIRAAQAAPGVEHAVTVRRDGETVMVIAATAMESA